MVERRQPVIAQQRSEDVRKLGNLDRVRGGRCGAYLPGSTRARQLIARTGIDYLTNLSRHSDRDWVLKRELAGAWTRIGILKGGLNYANLGDAGAALISFENAGRLLDEVQRHDPSDAQAALDRVALLYETSNVQWTLGRYNEAIASAQEGLWLAQTRSAMDAKNRDVVRTPDFSTWRWRACGSNWAICPQRPWRRALANGCFTTSARRVPPMGKRSLISPRWMYVSGR